MKKSLHPLVIIFCLLGPLFSKAQDCDILNRVQPDGSMIYYIKGEKFYTTKSKSLEGAVSTDGENYFLTLSPAPAPPKNIGKKISGTLDVTLNGGVQYSLKHFDSQYSNQDSLLVLLFTIGKEQLADFVNKPVETVKLDLGGPEKETYNFMLHKEAIQQQLGCFIDRNKKRK